jgi:hypothetical protein
MRSPSERCPSEQTQIEPREQSRVATQRPPAAAAADAYRQLSDPMIELVEAGLITISDTHGVLGRGRAVSVLADPANWCKTKARITGSNLAAPATAASEGIDRLTSPRRTVREPRKETRGERRLGLTSLGSPSNRRPSGRSETVSPK